MYGTADLLRVMQSQGAVNNPPTIQLATMTAYNTLMLGDELELSFEQLYFLERDTFRQCRTHRPPKKIVLSEPIVVGGETPTTIEELNLKSDSEVKGNDNSVYVKPYVEGDTVAVIQIGSGQYLVLGKIITGEEVKELTERVDMDWELEGNYDEPTAKLCGHVQ